MEKFTVKIDLFESQNLKNATENRTKGVHRSTNYLYMYQLCRFSKLSTKHTISFTH